MTPTFVKFSRVSRPLADVLADLRGGVFARLQVRLEHYAPLRHSYDAFDGGLELDGDLVQCDSEREVLRRAEGANCFGLSYVAARVPANLAVYFFELAPDGFGVSVVIEANMISYESDELAMGEWLFRLLVGVTQALSCEVVGYGRDAAYRLDHSSLDADVLVARLRNGELFEIPGPCFHAISRRLVSDGEMQHLLRAHPGSQEPTYKGSVLRPYVLSGRYHFFSRLPY